MAGGSKEPESPHDKKCPDCGLYYRDQGVSFQMHAASCSGQDQASEPASTSPDTSTSSQSTESPQTDASDDPTMGSGDIPESAKGTKQVLPCGCYSIPLDKYEPGKYKCDDCGHPFNIRRV